MYETWDGMLRAWNNKRSFSELDQFNKGILTWYGDVSSSWTKAVLWFVAIFSWIDIFTSVSATADCGLSVEGSPQRGRMDWVCLMCSRTWCLSVHVFLKSLCEESACWRRWTSGLQLGQCTGGNAEGKMSWCQTKCNAGASAAAKKYSSPPQTSPCSPWKANSSHIS